MNIKIKKQNSDGIVKLETSGEVKEVLMNQDLLSPKSESISVCFRGKNSSGIVSFSAKELEEIYDSVKGKMGLVKGVKIFRD